VLQHDSVATVATRFVAPLVTEGRMKRVARLHPLVRVAGADMIIAVDQSAAIPLSSIGPSDGSADHLRYEITSALDLLFSGF
jgi:hypothetical protein